MNTAYLNQVLIYLQQELPDDYRKHIQLNGERLIVHLPDCGNFEQSYEYLYNTIVSCAARIRNRDIDIEFTIKSAHQERDFTIRK